MNHSNKIQFTLPRLFLIATLLLPFAACSDDGGTESRVVNLAPSIRITGGPPEGTRDSYTTRIWWTGWDDDGIIDHYEYALDPPAAFTPAEINAPEEFLGDGGTLTRRVIRGPEEDTDTLRYSKAIDGQTAIMDYVQTRDFVRSFAFETPDADTLSLGGTRTPARTYSGIHVVYVRAADNEDARSDADRIGFTATTLTPSAEITSPKLTGAPFLTVGQQMRIEWDGTDFDAPDAQRKPTGYLYKMVQLNKLEPPIPITHADPEFVLFTAAAHIPWIYQSAETTSVRLFLEPASYVFGVRAVDVAGAVEPFVEQLRAGGAPGNAMLLRATQAGGFPILDLIEPTLGHITGSGVFTERFEVPVGQELDFTWTANAEAYGGVIDGFNYGWNIPDIERDGPGSGWVGWTRVNRNLQRIVFNKPGINVVYVKCRDTSGVESVAVLILNVIEFTFSKELLIIDDFKDVFWPTDSQHDGYWTKWINESGRFDAEYLGNRNNWYLESFGAGDAQFIDPRVEQLSFLGDYKTIIYDTRAAGQGNKSGLSEAGARRRLIGAYLGAGGKMWITGEQTSAAMFITSTGVGDFRYPHSFQAGDFGFEFFKLYTDSMRNRKYQNSETEGMYGVRPFPGVPEVFPGMDIDRLKVSPQARDKVGIGGADIVYEPIFEADNERHTGIIDSVYVFEAFGPHLEPIPKGANDHRKLCAIRWHDPNPDRRQGRVMWWGVPVPWFKDSEFQTVFNMAIDWFREESIVAP
jgi:hypothetical protein